MATIADMAGQLVQTLFMPVLDHILPKLDPTWEEVMRGAGTKQAYLDRMGATWNVIWPFEIGFAGAAEFAPTTAPNIATTPATPSPPGFNAFQDTESWPGLQESIAPTAWQKTISLKRMKVNFFMPRELIRLAQLNSFAEAADPMASMIRGCARNVSWLMCNAWYAQTGNSLANSLGSFTTGATPTIDASNPLAVTLDVAGTSNAVPNSIAKWAPGMRIDLFAYGSNTRLNTVPLFIDRPKGLNRTATYPGHFYIYSPFGSVTLANTVYHIVPRNSGREAGTNYLPTPLNSLMVSSGSLFGMDVTLWPWLQSLVETTSLAPTEPNLIKYLAELEQYVIQMGDDLQPDTFLMTPGVMSRFFQDYEQLKITNAGQPANLSGGIASKITYSLYGKTYDFRANRWLPQKQAILMKLKNNFQVVRPPRLPATQNHPAFDFGLEFLAGLWGGNKGIFTNYTQVGGGNAGAFTAFGHAPAEMIYDVLPKTFGGWVKFTNMTESYVS